jgi:hypothetical protein
LEVFDHFDLIIPVVLPISETHDVHADIDLLKLIKYLSEFLEECFCSRVQVYERLKIRNFIGKRIGTFFQ